MSIYLKKTRIIRRYVRELHCLYMWHYYVQHFKPFLFGKPKWRDIRGPFLSEESAKEWIKDQENMKYVGKEEVCWESDS